MKVDANYNQTAPYVRVNSKPKAENGTKLYSPTQEKVNMGHESKYSNIWAEIAGEYDIRNASFDELCDISLKLYEAGEISLAEHAFLTFDSSKSPQTIKTNVFLTKTDVDGKRDWIAEYQAKVNMDLKTGNMLGYKNNQRLLDILRRLR